MYEARISVRAYLFQNGIPGILTYHFIDFIKKKVANVTDDFVVAMKLT